MKVGIIGAGSLGEALFYFFKNNSFDVYVYDKDEELAKRLEKKGFKIFINNSLIKVSPFQVFKNIKKFPFKEIDFLIIAVKNYDLDEVAKELRKNSYTGPIVLVQNGIGIEGFFKKRRNLYRFVCHMAVYKDKNLNLNIRFLKKENFLGGGNDKEGKKIAEEFCKAGIKTIYKKDLKKYIWEKTILNSLLNPLSAIFKRNMEGTLKVGGVYFIIRNLLKEGIKVAEKEGVIFYKDFKKKAWDYIKKGKGHLPSMIFDLNKGKTEIDFLNGMISKIGKKHKIETPVNDFIVALIKILTND